VPRQCLGCRLATLFDHELSLRGLSETPANTLASAATIVMRNIWLHKLADMRRRDLWTKAARFSLSLPGLSAALTASRYPGPPFHLFARGCGERVGVRGVSASARQL
jgi:hypothetical protein